MKAEGHIYELIPPALLAEVEVVASAEHRSASEMVREAIELYLQERRTQVANDSEPWTPRTPQEAAARILELRKGNFLPEDETIRDLINYGRA